MLKYKKKKKSYSVLSQKKIIKHFRRIKTCLTELRSEQSFFVCNDLSLGNVYYRYKLNTSHYLIFPTSYQQQWPIYEQYPTSFFYIHIITI